MVESIPSKPPRLSIQRLRAAIWLIVASLRPVYRATVDGTLRAWQWYPASKGVGEQRTSPTQTLEPITLYPRSWFVYEGVFQTQLNCEQFSQSGLRTTKKPAIR